MGEGVGEAVGVGVGVNVGLGDRVGDGVGVAVGEGVGVGVGEGVAVGPGVAVGDGEGVGSGGVSITMVPLTVNAALEVCDAEIKGGKDAKSMMTKREIPAIIFEFNISRNSQSCILR